MALHNSGIGAWRHDNSPYGLVVMSPSANLPRCVMPFWTHAHAFSLYERTYITGRMDAWMYFSVIILYVTGIVKTLSDYYIPYNLIRSINWYYLVWNMTTEVMKFRIDFWNWYLLPFKKALIWNIFLQQKMVSFPFHPPAFRSLCCAR